MHRRPAFVVPRRAGATPAVTGNQNVPPASKPRARPAVVPSKTTGTATAPASASASGEDQHFTVLYAQRSSKKRQNKTFLDGVIVHSSAGVTLYSGDGKVLAKGHTKECVEASASIQVGNWEIEVEEAISRDAFRSGKCFLAQEASAAAAATGPAGIPSLYGKAKQASMKPVRAGAQAPAAPARAVLPEHALALNSEQAAAGTEQLVWLDSSMARKLRPHQQEGVQFLYSCVMGNSKGEDDENPLSLKHHGAILADEMGLGKSLQVLATATALMRSGPTGRPPVKKMLIVAPSSLTGNWGNEVKKWLGFGTSALVLLPGKEAANQVAGFKAGSKWSILIASYEYIQKYCADLQNHIQLLVCDEGHRLKALNGSNTMTALLSLNCPRRIILTGTPVQNNLEEFYAMMSFVNPGLLGSQATFSRVYAGPIKRAKEDGASKEQQDIALERSAELNRLIAPFILRRTADVNSKYLPPCLQYIVMCRPSACQLATYRVALGGWYDKSLSIDSTQVLPLISKLRQICNFSEDGGSRENTDPTAALQQLVAGSGKLKCLHLLLRATLHLGERMVVVSTSTQTLDVVQGMLNLERCTSARIDGATSAQLRQEQVDAFNRTDQTKVFLLSTRAGGAGLNLTGASRLVLFDSDWNPAMDAQAMARIWRDGQTRTCSIYRLLTTGLIDEKMYQRQLYKTELVGTVSGGGSKKGGAAAAKGPSQAFSQEQLKRLFAVNDATDCDTNDMLQGMAGAAAQPWRDVKTSCGDHVLEDAVAQSVISFVHLEAVRGTAPGAGGGCDGAGEGAGACGIDGVDGTVDGTMDGSACGGEMCAGGGAGDGPGVCAGAAAAGVDDDEVELLDADSPQCCGDGAGPSKRRRVLDESDDDWEVGQEDGILGLAMASEDH